MTARNDAPAADRTDPNDPDRQGSGKVANDHNQAGGEPATQTHQDRRTPHSRGDRDTHLGSGNQSQSRQGGQGSTGGGRGAG